MSLDACNKTTSTGPCVLKLYSTCMRKWPFASTGPAPTAPDATQCVKREPLVVNRFHLCCPQRLGPARSWRKMTRKMRIDSFGGRDFPDMPRDWPDRGLEANATGTAAAGLGGFVSGIAQSQHVLLLGTAKGGSMSRLHFISRDGELESDLEELLNFFTFKCFFSCPQVECLAGN